MLHTSIELNQVFKGLGSHEQGATLHTYVIDNSPEVDMDRVRPSIIICPGGGYGFTSDREAEPVALAFAAEGYNAFVLRYSVSPGHYPQQLLEVSAAVAYVRRMAKIWHVDTDKIIVCGFSAGGHLAGHLGVSWQEQFIQGALELKEAENKPNAMILGYPVITSGTFAHEGSFRNLLGESYEMDKEKVSLEVLVSELTPSAFIWHTFEDQAVPVENSMLFAQALKKYNIPFELHIYPKGGHGLSLCDQRTAKPDADYLVNTHVGTWFRLAIEWMNQL
ncbi:MAG: alpha/beta hydrolase [Clostridiales bacterium]|nr:alpha/beta hydrolase [Clostridiales bacterium]